MAQGKTTYEFTINNINNAVGAVQSFLQINKFAPATDKQGQTYYLLNDPMVGKMGLEYYVNGSILQLKVYIVDLTGTQYQLDEDVWGFATKAYFKNMLNPLLNMLQQNSVTAYNNPTPQVQVQQNSQPNMAYSRQPAPAQPQQMTNNTYTHQNNYNQPIQNSNYAFNNALQADIDKRTKGLSIAGLVISIITFIVSLFGVAWGVLPIFFTFWAASQGLKTSKKGMAIATIVFSALTAVISLFWIIMMFITM